MVDPLSKSRMLNHRPATSQKRTRERAKKSLPEVRKKTSKTGQKNCYYPHLIASDCETTYAPEHCLQQ